MAYGVPQQHAAVLGFVVALFISVAIGTALHRPVMMGVVGVLLGAYMVMIGAGLIRLKRIVTRMLG